MDYLEFIAQATSHIPDKGQVMIRYCGLYSNAHRGKIRKVYEIDPLLCPSWGGRIRIVSFIEEPKIIDRIIRHLELTFEANTSLRLVWSSRSF
jgi:hypothetical protein